MTHWTTAGGAPQGRLHWRPASVTVGARPLTGGFPCTATAYS